MRLAHLHLPGLTRYTHGSHLQETLIQRHFVYKDSLKTTVAGPDPSPNPPQPDPTILTFTCHPTYTVGRRYLSPPSKGSSESAYQISAAQQSFLRGPLHSLAAFHPSPRGGDLTFHGPGQLIAYPVLDLRRHQITPRAYISLLESTVQRTCARLSVPNTTTTANPGVWMHGGERKICAVGVQIRRGITGHGIALNVRDETLKKGRGYELEEGKVGGMLSWGFGRIVACGLEGKSVTWLTREGAPEDLQVTEVGAVVVEELAKGLNGVTEICQLTTDVMTEDLQRQLANNGHVDS